MTEEEARKKICPMRISVLSAHSASNVCLGSKCMAWRWNKVLVRGYDESGDMMATSHTHGHCGLAGGNSQ